MSIGTFFEKIGQDIEKIFKDLFSVTWEKKALSVLSYSAPFLEGIVAIADPAIAPMVTGVVNTVTADLTTVQNVVSQGTVAPGSSAATQVATALTAVKNNLSALLADSDVKNSTEAAKITAAANLVISEVDAILGEVPVTPAASAA